MGAYIAGLKMRFETTVHRFADQDFFNVLAFKASKRHKKRHKKRIHFNTS